MRTSSRRPVVRPHIFCAGGGRRFLRQSSKEGQRLHARQSHWDGNAVQYRGRESGDGWPVPWRPASSFSLNHWPERRAALQDYSLGLALFDYLPVAFSALGLGLLAQLLSRALPGALGLLLVGAGLVVAGGLSKATWKLIWVLTAQDVEVLDALLFICIAPGMILLACHAAAAAKRWRNAAAAMHPGRNSLLLAAPLLAAAGLAAAFVEGRGLVLRPAGGGGDGQHRPGAVAHSFKLGLEATLHRSVLSAEHPADVGFKRLGARPGADRGVAMAGGDHQSCRPRLLRPRRMAVAASCPVGAEGELMNACPRGKQPIGRRRQRHYPTKRQCLSQSLVLP